MERKVVITGMGIWSCLGTTLDEVRQSLYSGKSGIIFSQERKDTGFRSPFCADVPTPNLKPFVNRNFRQFMPEEAQYAYMATKDALADAKLDLDYIDKHEVGIIYGNDSVAEATMRSLDKFRQFGSTVACGSDGLCRLCLRFAGCGSGSPAHPQRLARLCDLRWRTGSQHVWCGLFRRHTVVRPPSRQ